MECRLVCSTEAWQTLTQGLAPLQGPAMYIIQSELVPDEKGPHASACRHQSPRAAQAQHIPHLMPQRLLGSSHTQEITGLCVNTGTGSTPPITLCLG